MQHICKKTLAIVLCLMLLVSATVNMSVIAQGSSPRENLLCAWENLVKEVHTPIFEGKNPPQGQKVDTVTPVTIADLPDELTAKQKAMFGKSNTIISKLTGTANIFNAGDSGLAYDILQQKPDIKRLFVCVYNTFDQAELHAYFNGANVPSGYNLIPGGFSVIELPEVLEQVKIWMNDTSTIPEDKSVSYICDYVSGEGEMYVGAVMYALHENETIPSEVNNLSNEELYDYVIENVDLDSYVDGVEEFKAALIALNSYNNPDSASAAVIEAWANLSNEVTETVSYPDVDAAGSVAVNPISELPDLGLTDEQIASFGSHFVTLNAVNDQIFDKSFSGVDFSSYNSLSISGCTTGYNTDGTVKYTMSGGSGYLVNYGAKSDIGYYTCSADVLKAGGVSEIRWKYSQVASTNDVTTVYIGSVIGTKSIKADVPTEILSLEGIDLLNAARELDTSAYTGGVEAFEAAVSALASSLSDPESAAVIEAWGNLVKQEGTVLMKAETPISELPELGLTTAQKAKLGTHFTELSGSASWTGKSGITSSITGYDSVTYSIYAAAAGRVENYANSYDWSTFEYLNQWYVINEAGFYTTDLTGKLLGKTGFQELNYSSGLGGPFYIGSVMGWKSVNETVPENVYSMSREQLYAAASKLDLTLYSDGVEEFTAALEGIKPEQQDPAVLNLIDAWGNLAKQEGTVLIKAETAISELPESLGLTAAQKAQMGTHFTKLEGASGWKTHKSGTFVFDGYDKITYSIYAAGTGRIENFVSNHAWGDMIYLNQYYTINETGFQTVDLTSKLSGATGIQESNYSSAFGGPFYVGSVMGWKFTKATVPASVSSMSAKELYDYAVANVNVADYTEGVEEFNAALAALKAVADKTIDTEVENGTLTVDKTDAAENDVIELTVAPEEGYVLKAGTLLAYDKDGKVIGVPTRKGFREGTESAVYEYNTALDGYDTANGITFKGEYVKESELTAPNMGKIGNSVNTEADVQGMRSVYRMPVTLEEDGKYYTTFGGSKKEVTSFGILLCSETTYNRLGKNIEVGANDQYLKEFDFINDKSIYWYRYDVCDSFEDISVMITGIEDAGMENTNFYSRGYIVADGVTYYTDATARSYSYYAN